ncbi:MAG: hypothetical protein U1E40_14945 [Amaricoccus sp.]
MNYAAAPIAADLGIRESLKDVMHRAAAALHAAIERRRARRDYRRMLESNDTLRDVGITREQVRQALRECGHAQ